MLAIQITANVFLLGVIGMLCFLGGLVLRQVQLRKRTKQVVELEKEMLKNHAEIIDLHRQIDLIKNHSVKKGATILKLKDGSMGDEKADIPHVSVRKKLLRKTSNLK